MRLSTVIGTVSLGAMSLLLPWAVAAENCSNPIEALPSSTWQTITPPKSDVEVVYLGRIGWVGLNHIDAIQQALTHRKRSLLPWVMPQIVTVFPFSRALEAPANSAPVFYVNHSETAAHIADLSSGEIHLLRFTPRGKVREIEVTTGASVFDFKTGFPSHREIPVSVNSLSNSIFSIRPKERLTDGEYMIVFGQVAAGGFEFGVHCMEKSAPAKVRVE
jgi:hypothetical protein